MTAQKRFINFRHDGSHVTSRARRCDVKEIKKLFLRNSNHIVLTNFDVRYYSRLVIDVLYKKFTKLLTDPRTKNRNTNIKQFITKFVVKSIYLVPK